MKKLLALVLALVMVMGLSVVSTNAAFSDAENIDHTEAVEVMNALNIINGFEDGSFQPDGNVTRAQMAKMVSIALLGDVEVSAFTGAVTDLTDINGHWAEGYIKYCYSQGIIAGKGNGIFDPNANVTTAEASKMLLVAMGYDATVRGYVGSQWTINVARDAQQKGLYDEIANLSSNKAMDRDDAAQLIYNTLTATRIERSESYDSEGVLRIQYSDATRKTTLLEKTFDSLKKSAYMIDVRYNDGKSEYTYDFDSGNNFDSGVINDKDNLGGTATLTSKTDYSELWGRKVSIVYDDDKNLIGVYAHEDSTVLFDGIMNNLDDGIAATDTVTKISDVNYDLRAAANTVRMYSYLDGVGAPTLATLDYSGATPKMWPVQLIDNNGDNKVDLAIYHPFTVARVSYVGSTTFNLSTTEVPAVIRATGTLNGIKTDSQETYSGMAKDDYVIKTLAANSTGTKDVYTKVEKVLSGKVTSTRSNAAQMDGSWYNTVFYAATDGITGLTLDATYNLALVGNYVVGYEQTKGGTTSKDYVVVVGQNGADTLYPDGRVQLLYTDGKTEIVVLHEDSTIGWGGGDTAPVVGGLYTYTTKSGKYLLTAANVGNSDSATTADVTGAAATAAGYDMIVDGGDSTVLPTPPTTYVYTSGGASTIHNAKISDDATVFVRKGPASTDFEIITGAQLKRYLAATVYSVNAAYANDNKSTGYSTIEMAYVTLTAGAGITTDKYAYITANVETAKNANNQNINVVTFWTDEGAVKGAKTKDGVVTGITKGSIITYNENSDGTYDIELADNVRRGAVTGWDGKYAMITGTGLTKASATRYEVTSDTKIIGINTDDTAGVEGATIAIAAEDGNGGYLANVYWVDENADNQLDVVFVDTYADAPKLKGTYTAAGTATTDDLMAAMGSWGNVYVNANWADDTSALTVPKGSTLTFSGTAAVGSNGWTINGSVVVSGALTVNGTATLSKTGKLTMDAAGNALNTGKITASAAGAKVVTGSAYTAASGTVTTIAAADATTANTSGTFAAGESYTWTVSTVAPNPAGWLLNA